jgi:hypothetical protein
VVSNRLFSVILCFFHVIIVSLTPWWQFV